MSKLFSNKVFLFSLLFLVIVGLGGLFLPQLFNQISHQSLERLEKISRPDFAFKDISIVEISGSQK